MTINRVYRGIKRRIAEFLATESAYHFLVRDWKQITDVELLVKVLGTEFFRGELRPIELPLHKGQRILVIAPHQDDEVIGAGGTLLKASKLGAEIEILFATDGSQDNIGYSVEESIKIRNEEAQKVCDAINAHFNVLPISNYNPRLEIDHLDELNEYISNFQPDVIMIPWILDAPIKHRMVNHLMALSHQLKRIPSCEIWGYQVHNTLYPNGYVDISEEMDDKNRLIGFYESQNNNIQRYDHLTKGMSAWNARFMPVSFNNGTIKEKFGEVFFTLPSNIYIELIHKYYSSNLELIYKGNEHLIGEFKKLINTLKK